MQLERLLCCHIRRKAFLMFVIYEEDAPTNYLCILFERQLVALGLSKLKPATFHRIL
jgi:hypothetical protein